MDSAYLKQTVGPAISEALTELILHGHGQISPNLSIDLESNPYSTGEDPISFVARYLLNYSEALDKCKRDDKEREKVTAMIGKIHKRKKEEEMALRKIEEKIKAQENLQAQIEQEKQNSALKETNASPQKIEAVAPQAEQNVDSSEIKAPDQNAPNTDSAPEAVAEGQ